MNDLPSLPRLLRASIAALALLAAAQVPAQPASAPAAATDDALYQQLGAQPGLVRLMDEFMVRLLADPRMQPFFKDANIAHVKEQLIVQFCEVSGGPCKRKGPDMKKTHEGMDINKNNFNALVEVLQQTMTAQGIAFGTQNKLLARLAPMHRDIINVP